MSDLLLGYLFGLFVGVVLMYGYYRPTRIERMRRGREAASGD